MSGEDHELAEDVSLRRFKALLRSDNPHVQAHIRGFLDAMDFMHAGSRPAEPEVATASFRGGSLKDVLSQVASHIASVDDARNGCDGQEPGEEGNAAQEDKSLH